MNAPATPAPESKTPSTSGGLSGPASAHRIRWLLGSLLVPAAVAAGVATAINAIDGGSTSVANGTGVGIGRVFTVPGSAGAVPNGAGANLGALWGKAFRGDAESYEPLSQAEAEANAVPAGGTVDRATDTLRLAGRAVALTIVANPPNGRDMAFRIAGLENPTIEVRKGAHVTVKFVNGDNDSAHGWTLLDPVVEAGGSFHGPRAFAGSYAPILGDPTTAGQPLETIQFVAATTGTYLYECPVPGHAAMGMRGTFKVTA